MYTKLFICFFILFELSNATLIDELSVEKNREVENEATVTCPCRRKVNIDLVKSLRRCSLVIDEGITDCQKKQVVSQEISLVTLQAKSCLCDKGITSIIESALKCCNDALDQVIRTCNNKNKAREEEDDETLTVGDDNEMMQENEELLSDLPYDAEVISSEENMPEEDIDNYDATFDSNLEEEKREVNDKEEEIHLEGYNGGLPSCTAIKTKYANSKSGYYTITPKKGVTSKVYCEMNNMCGTGGGWTRVDYRDVKKQGCPAGFVTYRGGNVVACGKPIVSSSVCSTTSRYYYNIYACQSLKLPTHGVSYSQICGQVIGYQYGAPYAFYSSYAYSQNRNNINRAYVDGISITIGSSRKHIWTYAAGYYEKTSGTTGCNCPKNPYGLYAKFVGHHYFCESGTPTYKGKKLYHEDPLWDGKQCNHAEKSCCVRRPLPMPWFKRLLAFHTTDYLELRVCGNIPLNADTPFSHYEFYVK